MSNAKSMTPTMTYYIDSTLEADLELLQANETYLAIMNEISYEAIYEDANNNEGFFTRMKNAVIEFIQKIWKWICSMWDWIVKKFDMYIQDNDSFVKKYRELLKDVKTTTFEGYQFSAYNSEFFNPRFTFKLSDLLIELSVYNKSIDEIKDQFIQQGTFIYGVFKSIIKSPEDITKENVKEALYGKKESREYKIEEQLNIIWNTSDAKVKLSRDKMVINQNYNSIVTNLKVSKIMKKLDDRIIYTQEQIKTALEFFKWVMNISKIIFEVYGKFIADRLRQAVTICQKAVEDNKPKSESVSIVPYTQLDSIRMIAEICQETSALQEKIQTEGLLLTAVGLGAATYAFGIKNVLKFLYWVISTLVSIIKTVIDKMKEFWAYLENEFGEKHEAFLALDHIKALTESCQDPYFIEAVAIIPYIGYDMTYNIDKLLNSAMADISIDSVNLLALANGNEKLFETHDDLLNAVALNRAKYIIHSRRPMIGLTYSQFKQLMKFEVFGEKIKRACSVRNANIILNNADRRKNQIKSAITVVSNNSKRDIQSLERKKVELTKNVNMLTNQMTPEIVQQFNWLIEYKTITMHDYLIIFEVLTDYTKAITLQAKLICSKALS